MLTLLYARAGRDIRGELLARMARSEARRRLLIVPQEGGAVLYLWDGGENCFRASTAVSSDTCTP